MNRVRVGLQYHTYVQIERQRGGDRQTMEEGGENMRDLVFPKGHNSPPLTPPATVLTLSLENRRPLCYIQYCLQFLKQFLLFYHFYVKHLFMKSLSLSVSPIVFRLFVFKCFFVFGIIRKCNISCLDTESSYVCRQVLHL